MGWEADWIDEARDRVRVMPDLAKAGWQGYIRAMGGPPLRGRYVLLRWKEPNVVIAHDNKDELFQLAQRIETTLQGFNYFDE